MNEGFTRIHMPGLRMPSYQTGHPVMGEIAPRRTAVFIGQEPKCIYLWRKPNFPKGETCTPIYDLGHAYPMKTAVRLGAISPITG